MIATTSRSYQAFLTQILSWAKECLTLIRFKKAWEKGKVPQEEMAAKALETDKADQRLVEEIFHADVQGHSPSLEVQRASTQQLAKELERATAAWPEPKIQVFGEKNGGTKKKERPANVESTPVVASEIEPLSVTQEKRDSTPYKSLYEPEMQVAKLEPVEVKPPQIEAREEVTPSFPNRPTILVIDDYKPLRRMIQKALHGACYNVCTAEDGVEGIVRVHENAVDLVVCDVQMPRLDGFEMSKMLNVRDSTREIPIIFLTEILDEQTKAIARRLGAADTLIKPFTMDSLFESIRAVLASHPAKSTMSTTEELEPALATVEG